MTGMRISSGIAEITSLSTSAGPRLEKTYLWPVYNNGTVNKIHGVTRRTDSSAVYTKPLGDDHNKLLRLSMTAAESEYTSKGNVINRSPLSSTPGSFFDALA